MYYIQHLSELKIGQKSCYSFSQSMQLGYSASLQRVQVYAWQAKLLPGVVLFASRDKLGQEYLRTASKYSNSACIMFHLLILVFSVFISSFSSFFFQLSSSYTERLQICVPLISFHKSRPVRSKDATASSPPQGNSNN